MASIRFLIVYRLYNKYSGEHFYTRSKNEQRFLVSNGWIHEKESDFESPGATDVNSVPLYRMYNPYSGLHHYTTNKEEHIYNVLTGWNDEGIGWYGL